MKRFTLLTAILALALANAGSNAAPEKIRVLLISGANNHNWRITTPLMQGFLERTGRFQVDVTLEPKIDLANAKKLARYQVLLLDYNGPRWDEPGQSNFLEAVKQGTGVVVIHAADNAFRGWKEYEKLIGIAWREGAGHGRFHEFSVKFTVKDHPITRGLKDFEKHPDELYHRLLRAPDAEFTVLATAFSDPVTGGTGNEEPMALVSTYGKGRMFHTPLGHHMGDGEPKSMLDPQFQLLVCRGTEWAATGQVSITKAPPPAPNDDAE